MNVVFQWGLCYYIAMKNELPNRKPNRLNNFDYSTNGAYFVTICTKDRKCILCDIVGDAVPTNAAIPSFVSTLKRLTNKQIGENIWQRSYHEHIIRDEKDYLNIWEYINSNALKWQDDKYYNRGEADES